MTDPKIPKRLRRKVKALGKKTKVFWCPMDGTAWLDRKFCNDGCKQRHAEHEDV